MPKGLQQGGGHEVLLDEDAALADRSGVIAALGGIHLDGGIGERDSVCIWASKEGEWVKYAFSGQATGCMHKMSHKVCLL